MGVWFDWLRLVEPGSGGACGWALGVDFAARSQPGRVVRVAGVPGKIAEGFAVGRSGGWW